MSKLAEKIRKASRLEAQPLGFVTSRSSKAATMLLGGVANDARGAAALIEQGADFAVMRRGSASDAAEANGALLGAMLEGDAEAKAYREGGFDFVVFDPDKTSSTAVMDEEIGYVMALPKDTSDTDLRSIEAFQLDAIDIGEIKGTPTVRRQIELRRIFGLTRKPLIATVAADISVAALQALRDTNVIAVTAEGAENIARLRKTIDELPPRARRKDEDRPTALVPRSVAQDDGEDDHDHDHD